MYLLVFLTLLLNFSSYAEGEIETFKNRTQTVTQNGICQAAAYYRMKDTGRSDEEVESGEEKEYFDYMVAKHVVELNLDTKGCKNRGYATLNIEFAVIPTRGNASAYTSRFGLVDPGDYAQTKEFAPFTEVSSQEIKENQEKFLLEYPVPENVQETVPAGSHKVIGRVYKSSVQKQVPCDGETHSGKLWVSLDPKGEEPRFNSGAYELQWKAIADEGQAKSEVNHSFHLSKSLVSLKKYLIPASTKCTTSGLIEDMEEDALINPYVRQGSKINPNQCIKPVPIPSLESLEEFGIFILDSVVPETR